MQSGTTYSLVDAEPHADAICEAIRAGRVRVQATPLSPWVAARVMGALLLPSTMTGRAPVPISRPGLSPRAS
ncbi:MAG TPA: hypothetical protein VG871_23640 [Vicinamibacterales bacterium]|nr:hypothetical protein [Vicinamibacterales bacterium]